MTKTQAISQMILSKVSQGASVTQALKEVIGEDAYESLIDELYNELREGRAA